MRSGDRLPREVAVLAAVAFAVAVGFGVLAPAIPAFAREFGVGRAAAGAVVSAFGLMRFASALLSGRLVERYGERRVLTVGLAMVAVSSALAGLSQSYPQLLVLRGVGGIGSAMFTVSAIGLLLRVVRADQRGQAMGRWQAGFLVGGMIGPLLGGLVTEISLRAPFFLYAVMLVVAGGVALGFLAGTGLRPASSSSSSSALSSSSSSPSSSSSSSGDGADAAAVTLGQALRQRAFLASLTGSFAIGWAIFGVRFSLIPLFVDEALGASASLTGAGLLLSSATQGALLLPAGRFVDRTGRRPALVVGAAVCAPSLALMAAVETRAFFLAGMAVFGAGAAFLGTAPAAIAGDVAGGRGGRVVAAAQMMSDAGVVVGPLAAGALADAFSYGAALGVTAAVVGAPLLLAVAMPETAPGRDRHTSAALPRDPREV